MQFFQEVRNAFGLWLASWLSLGHATFFSHLILLGDIKQKLRFWWLHRGGRDT